MNGPAPALLALAAAALALPGCAAGIATSAVGMAVKAATPARADPGDQRAAATAACTDRAATLGEVRIIDAAQRAGTGRVTVWGTVGPSPSSGPGTRQSFECRFDRGVKGFKLRAIAPR